MSIILPAYLDPILWFYGLDNFWLDIDEDAVVELGDDFVDTLGLVDTFASEVITVLEELEESTDTESFAAVRTFIDNTHKQDFKPVFEDIKVAVPAATGVIHHTVVAAKTTVLGVLTTNAAMDIPIIVSGQFWILAAKKIATKNLLDMLLYEAKETAVEELTQAATAYIETHWLDDRKEQWQESLANALASLVVTGTSTGGSASSELVSAPVDVYNCISKLTLAVLKFKGDITLDGLGDQVDDRIRDQSATASDGLVRVAVAELLKWGIDQVVWFVVDLAFAMMDSLTDMLTHVDDTLAEAEQEITTDAQALLISLAQLRPAGVANASSGAPDFFAPVREAMGTGPADANAENPDSLDAPVSQQRGVGPARANPQDVSVLDVSTSSERGTGRASGADGGDTADVDGTVGATSGPGAPAGGGSDAPEVDTSVDTTEGVDVPSSDSSGDVTELDAEVSEV